MARPTKYKPEYVEQAAKLCMLAATDQEMADFFDVTVTTLNRWKIAYPEFCVSIKAGKEHADERVERSLFQRATGYEQDEVKIFMPGGKDEPVYAPFRAKIAPDTTACIFWLKNRRPDLWRDKTIVDVQNNPELMSDAEIAAGIAERRGRLAAIRAELAGTAGTSVNSSDKPH